MSAPTRAEWVVNGMRATFDSDATLNGERCFVFFLQVPGYEEAEEIVDILTRSHARKKAGPKSPAQPSMVEKDGRLVQGCACGDLMSSGTKEYPPWGNGPTPAGDKMHAPAGCYDLPASARKRGAKDSTAAPATGAGSSPLPASAQVPAGEVCIFPTCSDPAIGGSEMCAGHNVGGISPEVQALLRAKKEATHG